MHHLIRVARAEGRISMVIEYCSKKPQDLRLVVHCKNLRSIMPPNDLNIVRSLRNGGHGNREGDFGTLSFSIAFGQDATSMRLYNTLADREPQALSRDPLLATIALNPRELLEQIGQLVGGYSSASVCYGERDVNVFPRCTHPDRC